MYFYFFEIYKIVKLIEAESRIIVTRDWGKGKWGVIQWLCKRSKF
jgi:hypothetical protein